MSYVDFATSAPNLETLSVLFDKDHRIDPPDLKQVVRDFQWSRLTSATFGRMSTRADTLIGFCDRHAGTLKDFGLTDIRLLSGHWSSVFLEMRQKLELKKMTVVGFLQSARGTYWFLGPGRLEKILKRMIEMYILHADPLDRSLPYGHFILNYMTKAPHHNELWEQLQYQPHGAS